MSQKLLIAGLCVLGLCTVVAGIQEGSAEFTNSLEGGDNQSPSPINRPIQLEAGQGEVVSGDRYSVVAPIPSPIPVPENASPDQMVDIARQYDQRIRPEVYQDQY